MAKKITEESILKAERRSELTRVADKFGINIEDKTMDEVKKLLIERLKNEDLESNVVEEDFKKTFEKKIDTEEKIIKNENKKDVEKIKCSLELIRNWKEKFKVQENEKFDTTKLVLYKDSDLTLEDEFILAEQPFSILEFAVLKNKEDVCGILQLVEEDGKKYFIADKKNIEFDLLNKYSKCELIVFKEEERQKLLIQDISNEVTCYSIDISVETKEYPEMSGALCIDFGTSNTSVGAYIPEERKTKLIIFKNSLNNNERVEIVPTVIYVEDCTDEKNIKYKFGYEAKAEIKKKDYVFDNTVFYEIKKWLMDIDVEEEIIDENGKKIKIKRKKILRAYFDYLLKKAKEQLKMNFKKLHFTTPIKIKTKYLDSLKEILSDYDIKGEEESLDEGVAVIYNSIREKIEKESSTRKTMIIDVGGGTTDVVSCKYFIKGDNIELEIYPENSDVNFGGNNITYRIFQYLKIKLGKYYSKNENAIDEVNTLIEGSNIDILDKIDDEKKGIKTVYEKFEAIYKEMSKVVPTNFKNNSDFKTIKAEKQIKRNFYLIWEAAEIIKKEFFKKTDIYLIGFSSENEDKDKENKKIRIPLENLTFSAVENGELKKFEETPEITISIDEIKRLIYGDIYNLLRKILCFNKETSTNISDEYSNIILSGQTCKISLFVELLKEFVAGRDLRNFSKGTIDEIQLKLKCINGSIEYIKDVEQGIIVPTFKNIRPKLKNVIKVPKRVEEVLLSKDEFNILSYDYNHAHNMEINVYNEENELIKKEVYNFAKKKDGSEITINEFKNKFKEKIKNNNLNEDKIDNLIVPNEEKILIAAIPSLDMYNFEIIEIYMKNGKIYESGNKIFTFEKNTSESKFFNGEDECD